MGPSFEEIVSEIKDNRKGNNKVAIVIASNKGNHILEEHLSYLKNQTFKDFDIIIVYGKYDDFLKTPRWASMVHIRRKEDVGFAIAFYIGEKFFLENGYDMFIEADNYSYPKSKDIVERLVMAIKEGNEFAYPIVQYEHTTIKEVTKGIRHYGCVRRSLIERVGLVYSPFYAYADDMEHQIRLTNNAKKQIAIDSILYRVYRVKGDCLASNTFTYYKTRNHLILFRKFIPGFKMVPAVFLNIIQMLYIALFHIISGNRIVAIEIIKGVIGGAFLSLKVKKTHDGMLKSKEQTCADFDVVMVDSKIKNDYESKIKELRTCSPDFKVLYYKRDNEAIKDLKYLFLPFFHIFGKKLCAYIVYGNFFLYTFAPFFGKTLCIYGNKEYVILKDKDSSLYKIGFFAASPLIFLFAVLLFFIAIFNPRRINTYGYGTLRDLSDNKSST